MQQLGGDAYATARKNFLDALAKHLDHKLRQANVPAPERTDRSPESEE